MNISNMAIQNHGNYLSEYGVRRKVLSEQATDFYTVSASERIKAAAAEPVKKESLSDAECFRELCSLYPEVEFVVQDFSLDSTDGEWLPKKYKGICNTADFGDISSMSIVIDVDILKKSAKDPEFFAYLKNSVEKVVNDYPSMRSECFHDKKNHMIAELYLNPKNKELIEDNFITSSESFDMYLKDDDKLSASMDALMQRILAAVDKEKQDRIFQMMDTIHENSLEYKEKLEEEEKQEDFFQKGKIEEYEKTFLWGSSRENY